MSSSLVLINCHKLSPYFCTCYSPVIKINVHYARTDVMQLPLKVIGPKIWNSIDSKNPYLLTRAFSTYVRPILDICFHPYVASWISQKGYWFFEKVQMAVTKTFHNLRLSALHWCISALKDLISSLICSLRHSNLDLCTCYRLSSSSYSSWPSSFC